MKIHQSIATVTMGWTKVTLVVIVYLCSLSRSKEISQEKGLPQGGQASFEAFLNSLLQNDNNPERVMIVSELKRYAKALVAGLPDEAQLDPLAREARYDMLLDRLIKHPLVKGLDINTNTKKNNQYDKFKPKDLNKNYGKHTKEDVLFADKPQPLDYHRNDLNRVQTPQGQDQNYDQQRSFPREMRENQTKTPIKTEQRYYVRRVKDKQSPYNNGRSPVRASRPVAPRQQQDSGQETLRVSNVNERPQQRASRDSKRDGDYYTRRTVVGPDGSPYYKYQPYPENVDSKPNAGRSRTYSYPFGQRARYAYRNGANSTRGNDDPRQNRQHDRDSRRKAQHEARDRELARRNKELQRRREQAAARDRVRQQRTAHSANRKAGRYSTTNQQAGRSTGGRSAFRSGISNRQSATTRTGSLKTNSRTRPPQTHRQRQSGYYAFDTSKGRSRGIIANGIGTRNPKNSLNGNGQQGYRTGTGQQGYRFGQPVKKPSNVYFHNLPGQGQAYPGFHAQYPQPAQGQTVIRGQSFYNPMLSSANGVNLLEAIDDECPETGIELKINGLGCKQAIDHYGSYLCYAHQFTSRQCCQVCGALRQSQNIGCEFGDHAELCKNILAADCYDLRNKDSCCQTCNRLKKPGAEVGCEWGDMTPRCDNVRQNPGLCYIPDNQRLCCETCASIRNNSNQECPWGDQNSNLCQLFDGETARIRINCYSPQRRRLCCQSCERLKAWIPIDAPQNCEYGDRPVIFKAARLGRLNCTTIFNYFDLNECRTNPAVSVNCCHTCHRLLASHG